MSNSFFKFTFKIFITFFISLVLTCCFFIPIICNNSITSTIDYENTIFEDQTLNDEFIWPIPGCIKITSNFGIRKSPTTGASTNHQGIDIGAPVGTNIISIQDGIVISTKFSGAGGYTIIIKHNETYTSNYCHVDPTFLVTPGQTVYKGQTIAKVGPKNVYGIPNNPYKDKNGNPTNGATTGPHLHFGIKKNGKFISPLSIF